MRVSWRLILEWLEYLPLLHWHQIRVGHYLLGLLTVIWWLEHLLALIIECLINYLLGKLLNIHILTIGVHWILRSPEDKLPCILGLKVRVLKSRVLRIWLCVQDFGMESTSIDLPFFLLSSSLFLFHLVLHFPLVKSISYVCWGFPLRHLKRIGIESGRKLFRSL